MLGFIKDLLLLPTSPLKFLIFFYIGFAVETDQSSVHLRRESKAWILCPFFMCCGVIQLDSCSYSLNLSLISVATAKKKSWHIYQFVWPFSLVSFQRVLSLCESSNGMSQLILWKKPRCTAAHFVTGFSGWLKWSHVFLRVPCCYLCLYRVISSSSFIGSVDIITFLFFKDHGVCYKKLLKKGPELNSKLWL